MAELSFALGLVLSAAAVISLAITLAEVVLYFVKELARRMRWHRGWRVAMLITGIISVLVALCIPVTEEHRPGLWCLFIFGLALIAFEVRIRSLIAQRERDLEEGRQDSQRLARYVAWRSN
ncbi:hypothetical protein KKB40_06545, partial [Patescibacteria group bacterium]|nr:hypothetical protein [Patescibacteria group bacterium]